MTHQENSKHFMILGAVAVTVVSLLACVGSANAAPVITSPAGTEFTGEVKMTAVETLTMKKSVFTETCTVSEFNFTVSTNNATHAEGAVSKLHFTSCDSTVAVLANGSLTINDKGEVFTIGGEATTAKFGTSCTYGGGPSPGTKLGTLTAGTTATLTISASLPRQVPTALCPSVAIWSGKYSVTSPDTLLIT